MIYGRGRSTAESPYEETRPLLELPSSVSGSAGQLVYAA